MFHTQTVPLPSHCLAHASMFFFLFLPSTAIERPFHHSTPFYFPFQEGHIDSPTACLFDWHTNLFSAGVGQRTGGGSRPTAGTAPFVERQIGRRGKSLLTQSHTLLITRGCKDDSAFQFFITLRKIELGIIRSTKQGGTTIKTNNNQFSAARTVQCGINPNTNKKICIFKWKRCLLIVWEQKAY